MIVKRKHKSDISVQVEAIQKKVFKKDGATKLVSVGQASKVVYFMKHISKIWH